MTSSMFFHFFQLGPTFDAVSATANTSTVMGKMSSKITSSFVDAGVAAVLLLQFVLCAVCINTFTMWFGGKVASAGAAARGCMYLGNFACGADCCCSHSDRATATAAATSALLKFNGQSMPP